LLARQQRIAEPVQYFSRFAARAQGGGRFGTWDN